MCAICRPNGPPIGVTTVTLPCIGPVMSEDAHCEHSGKCLPPLGRSVPECFSRGPQDAFHQRQPAHSTVLHIHISSAAPQVPGLQKCRTFSAAHAGMPSHLAHYNCTHGVSWRRLKILGLSRQGRPGVCAANGRSVNAAAVEVNVAEARASPVALEEPAAVQVGVLLHCRLVTRNTGECGCKRERPRRRRSASTGRSSGTRSPWPMTWTPAGRTPGSCSASAWCCGAPARAPGSASRTAARTAWRRCPVRRLLPLFITT